MYHFPYIHKHIAGKYNLFALRFQHFNHVFVFVVFVLLQPMSCFPAVGEKHRKSVLLAIMSTAQITDLAVSVRVGIVFSFYTPNLSAYRIPVDTMFWNSFKP